jgi:hypothetical protein
VSVSICLNCPNLFCKIHTWVIFRNIESNIVWVEPSTSCPNSNPWNRIWFLKFRLKFFHACVARISLWRVAGANRCLDSAQPLAHVNVVWRRFRKDHNFDVVSISRIYFVKCWVLCLFKIHGLREYEFGILTHSCDSCPRQIKRISATKVFGAK